MHFSKAFFVCASFVAAVVAQSKIGFTQAPTSVTAGTPTELKWSGGDGSSPVTITLRKGNAANLQTVSIITGNTVGNSFTWTPSKSLPNADDYALQISQGNANVNYYGPFSLTGGAASGSSSSGSSSASGTATSTVTISTTAPAIVTTTIGSSSTEAATTTTESVLIVSSNTTLTSVSATEFTTTLGASASGTGISVARNTTFVSQSLTASSSGPLTTGIVVTPTTKAGGSSTGSASASATTTGSAVRMGSPLALLGCVFVAMVYLN